jgi:hypothetical protein
VCGAKWEGKNFVAQEIDIQPPSKVKLENEEAFGFEFGTKKIRARTIDGVVKQPGLLG